MPGLFAFEFVQPLSKNGSKTKTDQFRTKRDLKDTKLQKLQGYRN